MACALETFGACYGWAGYIRVDFIHVRYDAIVTGSGPNGLSAAIYLQQKGLRTLIVESASEVGGATRTAELTLPGYYHDLGSAVHPLAVASPWLSTLPLGEFGLEWIYPDLPLAHPFPNGEAILMHKDIRRFAASLGSDEEAYLKLIEPLAANWNRLAPELLGPLSFPAHPFLLARFGLRAFWSAETLAKKLFSTPSTQAFFAGLAAHSGLSLNATASAAFGLVLAIVGHAVHWPIAKGGAKAIPAAMQAYYQSLGGEVICGQTVSNVGELPGAKVYLFDVTPAQLVKIRGLELSGAYKKHLSSYRYGPGVFKMDFALNAPIPWKNQACLKAGTIHLGQSLEEISASEVGLSKGIVPERPYIILSQPSLFDRSRASEGGHTAWAYCHVPNGSTEDMSERMIRQIERVAPGFRDTIQASHTMTCPEMEAWNANLVGGDVNGGLQNVSQLFFRPVVKATPYRTSSAHVYLCSSSTPPGGGVHGMCGFHAARTAFEDHFN